MGIEPITECLTINDLGSSCVEVRVGVRISAACGAMTGNPWQR